MSCFSYPDATAEELEAGDNVCIICREVMADGCKKLPCNHIFHVSCLRSWFLRQQTCPTCRMDILQVSSSAQTAPARAAQPADIPVAPQPGQPQPEQQMNMAQFQRQYIKCILNGGNF